MSGTKMKPQIIKSQALQQTEGNQVDEFKDYKPAKELRPKMMKFAEYYLISDDKKTQYNATQSYLKAYGCAYSTANTKGGELLWDPRIQKYQRFLLLNSGFSDLAVDNKLKQNIFGSKGRDSTVAIREYNKLQSRIVDKRQVTIVDANRLIEQLGEAHQGDSY